MKIKKSVALATMMLGLAGCSKPSAPVTPTQAAAVPATPVQEIGLELLSIKDVPTQLAARAGKVVVLDMWATW